MSESGKKFRALRDKKINILTLVVRILLFFVAQSANFFSLNNKIIQLSRLPFLIIFCQQEMN